MKPKILEAIAMSFAVVAGSPAAAQVASPYQSGSNVAQVPFDPSGSPSQNNDANNNADDEKAYFWDLGVKVANTDWSKSCPTTQPITGNTYADRRDQQIQNDRQMQLNNLHNRMYGSIFGAIGKGVGPIGRRAMADTGFTSQRFIAEHKSDCDFMNYVIGPKIKTVQSEEALAGQARDAFTRNAHVEKSNETLVAIGEAFQEHQDHMRDKNDFLGDRLKEDVVRNGVLGGRTNVLHLGH